MIQEFAHHVRAMVRHLRGDVQPHQGSNYSGTCGLDFKQDIVAAAEGVLVQCQLPARLNTR